MSTLRTRKPAKQRGSRPSTPPQPQQPPVTYGKTPGGKVFTIPQTYDVLSGLFDPRAPKSSFDLIILATFAVQIAIFAFIPLKVSRYLFLAYFTFWRLAYNLGLGFVLTKQSKTRWVVRLAESHRIFDLGKRPKFASWIKRQLEARLSGSDYTFSEVPIEFNTWLAFRHIVDVILLNDFLAYCFFGVAWLKFPPEQNTATHILRWVAGWALVLFNVIVKMDAHRVVKDIAWYWGDAFFLTLNDLVFDGVFELAPHPMYSIGYAGYYGLSLISGSRIVFFVSLLAHCSQFLFLALFENPHIERTYGKRKMLASRSPVMRRSIDPGSGYKKKDEKDATPSLTSASEGSTSEISESEDDDKRTVVFKDRRKSTTRIGETSQHDLHNRYFYKNLILLRNFDFFRSADFNFGLAIFYMVATPLFSRCGHKTRLVALFANAFVWRCFHSFGLGTILRKQSRERWLVRHFLKHYNPEDNEACVRQAFTNWSGVYNSSLTMTYLSFALLSIGALKVPSSFGDFQAALLRYTCGCLLIALHVWVARETYEVLGNFGWFYGDFFIEEYPRSLLYTGIYRFLNNPERIVGGAAFLGMSFISGSVPVAILAIFSIMSQRVFQAFPISAYDCSVWFLQSVEKYVLSDPRDKLTSSPHMESLYGAAAIRKTSGFSKAVRTLAGQTMGKPSPQLSGAAQGILRTYEQILRNTKGTLDEFLRKSTPILADYIEDRRSGLNDARASFVITRKGDTTGIDNRNYRLSTTSNRIHLGEAISVEWFAPPTHSDADWVGIYRKGAVKSKSVTNIASNGRWLGTRPDAWDGDLYTPSGSGDVVTQGALKFDTFERLPVSCGIYELRLHHAGKHNVLAMTEVEIYVDKAENLKDWHSIYKSMRSLVYHCLHGNPQNLPKSLDDFAFNSDGKIPESEVDNFTLVDITQARVMAYAIKESCGIELDPQVVIAIANVQDLATRVFDAHRLLSCK